MGYGTLERPQNLVRKEPTPGLKNDDRVLFQARIPHTGRE